MDQLDDAVAAFDRARKAEAAAKVKARQDVEDARAEVARKRAALAEAIVAAARVGVRQRDIVNVTGYTRERIRQMCRAAGIEAADR